MPRVLVVEDEPNIADVIRRGLIFQKFDVDVAHTGAAALDKARDNMPDIVILDLMLPDMDGVEVCKRLRAAEEVPIIMLTARDATTDKVEGLEAGADDYMTKPFEFAELLARINVALRRYRRAAEGGADVLRVGDLVVKPGSREVVRGERDITLTAREFELLEYLARHAGQVVNKETLFEKVWGYDFDVESDAIKVYVSYLRKKLNAEGEPDLIHAIRGVGYVLKA
ncbi:MAG TPA: response regulator transcription factor [Dehalococcoidia bacterium]|nr:response regulator transcription factor [Dehalococcoidia bacterium]